MIFFKKNYFLFLLFFFTLHQFQFFTNFFIILKNDYTTRMIKYSGYCDNEGYGYIKFIKEKFKINENFLVKNFNDQPNINAYFHNINKNNNTDMIILIGANNSNIEVFLEKGFIINHSFNNCYYLKK